jgi:NTE family protein
MLALGVSSKVNAEWAFLTYLRDQGRKAAQNWLSRHYVDLGVRNSLDLSWIFDESVQPAHLPEGADRNYAISATGP